MKLISCIAESNQADKKKIKEWVEKNVEFLRGIHLNENGQFEIPFNQLIY